MFHNILHRGCVAEINFYLTSLKQARQFIDACGTKNPLN
jgi:hypothetical protein